MERVSGNEAGEMYNNMSANQYIINNMSANQFIILRHRH